MSFSERVKPAARVSGPKKNLWSIIIEAAMKSPRQPVLDMSQGSFGYNPPDFIINAAKDALSRVDCNQYAPTKGRPRLKKAIADATSPLLGRTINPETEVTITSGANEGMLSVFMAFLEQGDEVIVFEPFFDQYLSNIEMPGGKIVYIPMHPPAAGQDSVTSAADWSISFDELERAITPKTKMLVLNTPLNPVGKIYTKEELQRIGDLCVKHDIIILSDEVYERLCYKPFVRISTLSPEIEQLTIVVGSASKHFYVPGWRVGWLIGPPHLIKWASEAHTQLCFSSVAPLQEACAVAFEQADEHNFWKDSVKNMKGKMDRFTEIWRELDLPYLDPDGGSFVLVNMRKVKLPENYPFPPHVSSRARDFQMVWFLIQEFGVAGVPPTGFYAENGHLAENYVRFAINKDDKVIEEAKERLLRLKDYM